MRFRQKPGAGGWIDELNAVKTLTSLPPTWTTGTIYTAGAWTSVYGSGLTSAAPVATSTLAVTRLELDGKSRDTESRAGQREHYEHGDRTA